MSRSIIGRVQNGLATSHMKVTPVSEQAGLTTSHLKPTPVPVNPKPPASTK